MKERPILMTPENAQKCHEGTKTQTRRLVNPQPLVDADGVHFLWASFTTTGHVHTFDREGIDGQHWFADYYPHENPYEESLKRTNYKNPCRYGVVGDRLWVREALCRNGSVMTYRDGSLVMQGDLVMPSWCERKTIPSIHMPRWACRTVLEITDIRVERLQEISEEDAKAEGCKPHPPSGLDGRVYRRPFECLWESINGAGSWALNPWVWVIEFRKVSS